MDTESGLSTLNMENEGPRKRSVVSACPGACKVLCVTIALLCAFIAGVALQKHAIQKETRPTVSSSVTGHAIQQTGDLPLFGDTDDLLRNPNGTCTGPSCTRCKTFIRLAALNVLPGTPLSCLGDRRVVNQSCFLHRERCWTLHQLKENWSQHRHVKRIKSKCCLSVQMEQCNNGGENLCSGHDSEPVCQCPRGYRGEKCQERSIESVWCRCYSDGKKFCGEEAMVDCDNIPATWSQCHMYAVREGVELNCVCNSRSFDSGNADDDHTGEAETCSVPHSSAIKTFTAGGTNHAEEHGMCLLLLILLSIIYVTLWIAA